MSLKWIAQRLDMGSWTYVSNLLQGAPKEVINGVTSQQLTLIRLTPALKPACLDSWHAHYASSAPGAATT